MNQPIFITGVERSGSSIVAKIVDICGSFKGDTTVMYENIRIKNITNSYIDSHTGKDKLMPETDKLFLPVSWKKRVDTILSADGYKDGPWMLKGSYLTQTWPLWHYSFPNARWVIVRRRTGDIVQSCIKTGYMRMFKEKPNLAVLGLTKEEEGWLWWVHEYEKRFVEMIETGVNVKIIWPERMVHGDYQQIYETLEWLGLKWSSKIVEAIDPMLTKSRRKEQWHV